MLKFYPSYLKFNFHIQLSFVPPPIFIPFLWKAHPSSLCIFRNSNHSVYPLCDLYLQPQYVLHRLPCPNSVHWNNSGNYNKRTSGSYMTFQISTWQFSYSLVKFLKKKKKETKHILFLQLSLYWTPVFAHGIKCKWCFLGSHLAWPLPVSVGLSTFLPGLFIQAFLKSPSWGFFSSHLAFCPWAL